jgi:hypothetical protein
MRTTIPIIFVAATALVGCHSPSTVHIQTATPTVAAPAPFYPRFITTLGTTTRSQDGIWRVSVSAAGDWVDLSYCRGAGSAHPFWSTISVPGPTAPSQGWKAHAGWFVYVQDESRVWVYNGDSYLCLWENTCNFGAFYPRPVSFPFAVPAEVLSRLSESAKKDTQAQWDLGHYVD